MKRRVKRNEEEGEDWRQLKKGRVRRGVSGGMGSGGGRAVVEERAEGSEDEENKRRGERVRIIK